MKRLKIQLLSKLQKEIIIGSLLGDGSLEKSGFHFRFSEEHSIKQKEYLYWKYNFLKSLCDKRPKTINRKNFVSVRLRTQTGNEFDKLRKLWYKNRHKSIPCGLKLSPLMLGVWFMDDGDFSVRYRRIRISTMGFNKKENIFLRDRLKKDLGIVAKVAKEGKYYRLIISRRENVEKFIKSVVSFVPKTMRYKVNLLPYKNKPYHKTQSVSCEICGRKIINFFSQRQKFCSQDCYHISRKEKV